MNVAPSLVLATLAGETGSGTARRRCGATAASMAVLPRKVILRREPVTMVSEHFVETAADEAALRP